MRKLIKDATTVKIMGYSFKSKNKESKIEQENKRSINALLPKLETIEDKRSLVKERMSELFYIFGETLVPSKGEYDESQ
jgi:hypothetical protein